MVNAGLAAVGAHARALWHIEACAGHCLAPKQHGCRCTMHRTEPTQKNECSARLTFVPRLLNLALHGRPRAGHRRTVAPARHGQAARRGQPGQQLRQLTPSRQDHRHMAGRNVMHRTVGCNLQQPHGHPPTHLLTSRSVSTGICTRSSGLICRQQMQRRQMDDRTSCRQRLRLRRAAYRCPTAARNERSTAHSTK